MKKNLPLTSAILISAFLTCLSYLQANGGSFGICYKNTPHITALIELAFGSLAVVMYTRG